MHDPRKVGTEFSITVLICGRGKHDDPRLPISDVLKLLKEKVVKEEIKTFGDDISRIPSQESSFSEVLSVCETHARVFITHNSISYLRFSPSSRLYFFFF